MNDNVPLYNSRIINTYLEFLNEHYPDLSIESVLEYAGMKPYEVEDPAHWFSQRQVNRFQEILLEKTRDPDLARKSGRFTVLSKKIGAVKQYTLGLMSPASVYMMSGKLYHTMSKGATVTTRRLGANKVKVVATPRPGVKEEPFQCKNRIGTLESLAKLFTEDFALVEHPQCYHNGDDHCCYIISWTLTRSALWERRRNIGLLASAVIAVFLHLLAPLSVWIAVLSLAAAFTAVSAGMAVHNRQKELSTTIASQGSTAVDLLEAINLRYNNALLMQEIGQAAATILEQQHYIEAVMQVMAKRMDFDRGLIMLESEEDPGKLQYAASYGHTEAQRKILLRTAFNLNNPAAEGIFVRVFKEQESFLVEDTRTITASLTDHSKFFAETMASRSFICVPVVYKKRTLGLIAVDNLFSKKPLTKSDLNILKAIASQVAIGIANAKAFKSLQEKEETLRNLYESTKKTEQLYSSLLLSSPDAIVVYGPEGGIRYLNPAFSRIFGWTPAEAEALLSRAVTAPAGGTIFGWIQNMAGRSDNFVDFETRQPTRSGDVLDLTISASHFDDHQGDPAGVLFIIRDISEKKRLEEQLLQAQKMEALGTLVAGVAHEINNPVNGIINYAQLMVDQEEAGGENAELAGRIINEGERIATIVKNLLSIARTSEGERVRAGVRELLLEALALMEHQFRKGGVNLTVSLPADLPQVFAVAQEIQQVFLNVLSNAEHALNLKAASGPYDKKLDIRAEKILVQGREFIRIVFFDNGTGIPPEILPKVCNPFFSTKPPGQGTGLGLSISHGIIKDHGGMISFESLAGEFTRVIIDLRVQGADNGS